MNPRTFKERLLDILVRALKTFAQSFLAVLAASGTGYLEIDALKAASIAGGAAIISFLQNLTSESNVIVIHQTEEPQEEEPAAPISTNAIGFHMPMQSDDE